MKRFLLPPLFAVILAGATPASPQPFVAGEVMVSFVCGSEGRSAVSKALQNSPPDLQPLEPAIAALQALTRLPLKPVRLTGGNWLLLRVDFDRLSEQAASRIRKRGNVASLRPWPAQPVQSAAPRGLIIEFAPSSPEFRIITRPEPDDHALLQLVNDLAAAAECPLGGVVQEHRFLAVEIDLAALTRVAVERLKTVADVENAQPNFIVGFRPPP